MFAVDKTNKASVVLTCWNISWIHIVLLLLFNSNSITSSSFGYLYCCKFSSWKAYYSHGIGNTTLFLVCVTKIVVSLNLPSNFLYLSLSANNVIMILHRRFGSTSTSKMFIGNQKNPLSAKVIEEKFYWWVVSLELSWALW